MTTFRLRSEKDVVPVKKRTVPHIMYMDEFNEFLKGLNEAFEVLKASETDIKGRLDLLEDEVFDTEG